MAIGDPCTGSEAADSWEKAFCQESTAWCSQFSSTCSSATGWTNAGNAQSDDGLFATALVTGGEGGNCSGLGGVASPWQTNTGYPFNIPSDATIKFVVIGVKGQQPAAGACNCPMLVTNYAFVVNGVMYPLAGQTGDACAGSVRGGFCNDFGPIPSGQGTSGIDGPWPLNDASCQPLTEGVVSSKKSINPYFGCSGTGDYALAVSALGAPTLTPALVNAANFGAAILARSNCTDIADTVYLDAIGIGVYYQAGPSGCGSIGPTPPQVGGINGVTRQVFNVFDKRRVWGGR